MKAIILVGGLGTRLRPLTINTPKSLVPILNLPFLEYVLQRLKSYGVNEVVLTLSHLAPAIEECFGNGSRLGLSVEYVLEPSPLGTAGAVRNAAEVVSETFIVLNGDIFTELDISSMLAFHKQKKALATIALTPVENPSSYGLVETDKGNRVTKFLEKPGPKEITTNMINAGTYILEPEVLNGIPANKTFSFEKELFPYLLNQGMPFYAFKDSGYWIDIGTPQKYQKLNNDLLCGQGGQYSFPRGDEIIITPGSQIHPTAQLKGPILIGGNCTIREKVAITGPSVIGPNCQIEDAATITSSIIWHGVTIGSASCIKTSVVAHECHLETGSQMEDSVIGDHVLMAQGYTLKPGSYISPGTILR
jgi:mannose-1-phosphate guanylyltransferase